MVADDINEFFVVIKYTGEHQLDAVDDGARTNKPGVKDQSHE
jgi:hypothetical protein